MSLNLSSNPQKFSADSQFSPVPKKWAHVKTHGSPAFRGHPYKAASAPYRHSRVNIMVSRTSIPSHITITLLFEGLSTYCNHSSPLISNLHCPCASNPLKTQPASQGYSQYDYPSNGASRASGQSIARFGARRSIHRGTMDDIDGYHGHYHPFNSEREQYEQ